MRNASSAWRVDFGIGRAPASRAPERLGQRDLQHFVHGLDHVDVERVEHVLRDVRQVLLVVACGTMIVFRPARCAARTFSFTPPIGRTLPRSVISPVIATSLRDRRSRRERRDQRGRQRDAGRRAVLRDRPFGDVDVDVGRAVEVLRDAELVRPCERT